MGRRVEETFHVEQADAEAAQLREMGIPGYSEVYSRGVFPCKVKHPETGEEVDGWKSVTETYYG